MLDILIFTKLSLKSVRSNKKTHNLRSFLILCFYLRLNPPLCLTLQDFLIPFYIFLISLHFLSPSFIWGDIVAFPSSCIWSTLVVTISPEGTRPSSKIHRGRLINTEGRLGRSYHLHLQGEAVAAARPFSLECLTLNLQEICFSETSVPIYQ
jgi:hypothetical protein